MSYMCSCIPVGSEVLGRELQILALEHPNAALALGSALPSPLFLSCFLHFCPLPSLRASKTSGRAVNDDSGAENFGNVVAGASLA